jgi:hypothetical protein
VRNSEQKFSSIFVGKSCANRSVRGSRCVRSITKNTFNKLDAICGQMDGVYGESGNNSDS